MVQGFSIVHQLVLGFICVRPAAAMGVSAAELDADAVEAA
jgi:hypothetical protein